MNAKTNYTIKDENRGQWFLLVSVISTMFHSYKLTRTIKTEPVWTESAPWLVIDTGSGLVKVDLDLSYLYLFDHLDAFSETEPEEEYQPFDVVFARVRAALTQWPHKVQLFWGSD